MDEVKVTNQESWLSLTEYASKYGVSISTLRRRIKTRELEYQFDDGKYLVKDSKLRPQNTKVSIPLVATSSPQPQNRQGDTLASVNPEMTLGAVSTVNASQVTDQTVERLLGEVKKAYAIILQEKEEQIIQLKEEVADLKTLARVFEEENDRLKRTLEKAESLDNWLKSV